MQTDAAAAFALMQGKLANAASEIAAPTKAGRRHFSSWAAFSDEGALHMAVR